MLRGPCNFVAKVIHLRVDSVQPNPLLDQVVGNLYKRSDLGETAHSRYCSALRGQQDRLEVQYPHPVTPRMASSAQQTPKPALSFVTSPALTPMSLR